MIDRINHVLPFSLCKCDHFAHSFTRCTAKLRQIERISKLHLRFRRRCRLSPSPRSMRWRTQRRDREPVVLLCGRADAPCRSQYPPQLYRHILIYTNQTLSAKSVVLPAPRTLLDIGCGPGLSTFAFAPSFNKLVGIDPSAGMISAATEIAKEKSLTLADKEIEFVVGFGEDLSSFPDASVDLVVAGTSLSLVPIAEMLAHTIQSCRASGTLVRDAQSLSRVTSSTQTEWLFRFLGQSLARAYSFDDSLTIYAVR